ncbi:MAG: MerR family transcriptional regulator [Planctomycetes bacterium]|nr:MerR family transcriptional regulator [Planctomycetota bacterium]
MEPPPIDAGWDIAQLAKEGEVSSRTIRYYSELGLLRATGRGPGGRRIYATDALERLNFITRLKRLGLTLEQIGALNRAFDEGQTPGMLARLDRMLGEQLERARVRLTELHSLEQDLQDYRRRIQERLDPPRQDD